MEGLIAYRGGRKDSGWRQEQYWRRGRNMNRFSALCLQIYLFMLLQMTSSASLASACVSEDYNLVHSPPPSSHHHHQHHRSSPSGDHGGSPPKKLSKHPPPAKALCESPAPAPPPPAHGSARHAPLSRSQPAHTSPPCSSVFTGLPFPVISYPRPPASKLIPGKISPPPATVVYHLPAPPTSCGRQPPIPPPITARDHHASPPPKSGQRHLFPPSPPPPPLKAKRRQPFHAPPAIPRAASHSTRRRGQSLHLKVDPRGQLYVHLQNHCIVLLLPRTRSSRARIGIALLSLFAALIQACR